MRILPVGFFIRIDNFSSSYAADIYNGTLIDAHCKGVQRYLRKSFRQINKSDVDFTLLSFRGGPPKLLSQPKPFGY